MTFDVLSLLATPRGSVLLDSVGTIGVTMTQRSTTVSMISTVAIGVLPPVVDVPATGVRFPFDWGAVLAGTDRVELAPIQVEVATDGVPAFGGYSLGELATEVNTGGELVVTVPTGRRIRSLNIPGLKSEDLEFSSEQSLNNAGRRLTVSAPDPRGGWAAPVVSVPAVGRQGQIPSTLTGASFTNSVLRLPDLTGPLKIAIVDGATPDTFTVHKATAGKVVGWAAPTPVDLTLTGPDGTALWNFAGAMPAGTRQHTDVTVAVAAAVETLREAGAPITGALTLTSAFPCKVRLRIDGVRGDLIHDLPGTTTVALAGEPVPLPLTAPLPVGSPETVVADVTVSYDGRRLADISDPLPPAGSHRGVVVRQDPVLRLLPPQALRGERVSRIGLVGYCPQPSALLLRLIPAAAGGTPTPAPTARAGPATPPIGRPGTAKVDPTTGIGVIWVDLPEPVTIDQPVAIEVSAGSGSLNWVADPDPLVRIVVLDPDPGGRPIVLGGGTLLTVDQPKLGTVRAALPAAPFTGGAPPLASALFCTVEITDAELRYPRGT